MLSSNTATKLERCGWNNKIGAITKWRGEHRKHRTSERSRQRPAAAAAAARSTHTRTASERARELHRQRAGALERSDLNAKFCAATTTATAAAAAALCFYKAANITNAELRVHFCSHRFERGFATRNEFSLICARARRFQSQQHRLNAKLFHGIRARKRSECRGKGGRAVGEAGVDGARAEC